MLSILVSAYACSPNRGSEPGMAWNWCVNIAKDCELHIITEGEFRTEIEAVLPTIPHGRNMHFYYNPVPDKVRKMCWNQGDWRFYWFYRKWQKKTCSIAKQIIETHPIDIVHQLNMIGAHGVGYLWKLDKPYVWGPLGGLGTDTPGVFLKGAGTKTALKLAAKRLIKKFTIRTGNIKRNIVRADALIAANQDNKTNIDRVYRKDIHCINETGLYPCEVKKTYDFQKPTFDLLWVGRFLYTKRLDIALRTIQNLSDCADIRLHIVGSGTESEEKLYHELAHELRVEDKCIFHGLKNHDEVLRMMRESDAFFFTSTNEGTPHVILEAIQNRLPVFCIDCCGQGDCVDNTIGIKVPLTSPEQIISDFTAKIREVYDHRPLLQQLSDNCAARQRELSWENKARKMIAIYNEVLQNSRSK